MNFSAFSIRNPIPAILLFSLLVLAGLLSFRALKIQNFPDIALPLITISAALPGATPLQMETDVATKIENAVASIAGVKHIYTNLVESSATINVEFVLETDPANAVNEVRDAVSQIRSDLPSEMREPTVSKVSTAGGVVQTFVTRSTLLDEVDLSWFVDNTVTRRLKAVPGVGDIKRVGGVNREVMVELDPVKMEALGLAPLDVSTRLKMVQQNSSGGRGDVSGAKQTVRAISAVNTVDELASLELPLPGGSKIRLDEVASIRDTIAERRSLAYQDGKPVIAFDIFRTKGASEIDVAKGVAETLAEIASENPETQFVKSVDNLVPIQEGFDGSMTLLYEGAILTVIVVWLFLRDWRATFISAAALPLSMIPTFLGMRLFDFTLNTVTMTSMALVVGILVDDAIVEIENISRHLQMGKKPFQAAMEAADEIGLAVIATTFALVAVFLPTAFMDGIPGKFLKQFGWTAVLAILASLLVARLITPMMAAYLLRPRPRLGDTPGWFMLRYLSVVYWTLRHRWVTTLAAALFLAGSIALAYLLPTGFIPSTDSGQTQINIELPPGATLLETNAIAEQARIAAMRVPEVKAVFSSLGSGTSGEATEARKATLTVSLSHRNDRTESLPMIESAIRERLREIAGARFTVGLTDGGTKLRIVLLSADVIALEEVVRQVETDLRTLKGIGDVSSTISLVRPEITVRADLARAADLGVTTQSIGDTIRVATAGDYEASLARINVSERQVPIVVKLPDTVRSELAQIERLTVPGKNGPVQLGNVAVVAVDSGPAQIDRTDRKRATEISVELGNRSLGNLFEEAMSLVSLKNLPPSIQIAPLGDAQEMQELMSSFGTAMMVGVFCIYIVLVLLFKDFMQPITILTALPLSVGGAVIALLVTHYAFSMPSMIGLIMLMGVVTKNSILLVEYAIMARRDKAGTPGLPIVEAIINACRKRSRPIAMTTIAMSAGMLPLALGYGADPSFSAPMAVAVIGGLITSTILSLLVVPAVYSLVDGFKGNLSRLFFSRLPKYENL